MKLTSSDSVQSLVAAVAQMRLGMGQPSGAKLEQPVILPDTTISQLKGMEWLYQRFDNINTKHKLKGRMGECYHYAFAAASENTDLAYCEGQAISRGCPVPVTHAWCVDIHTNEVVDPVWKRNRVGEGYCGIPMNIDFVSSVASETGYRGVVESLWMAKSLWSVLLKDVVHPAYHAKVFHSV